MATNNKPGKTSSNRRPPNSYWIWAGIILIFLGLNFFGSGGFFGGPKTITPSKFKQYLKEGDVQKVVVLHHKTANVYLTKGAQKKLKSEDEENQGILPNVNAPDFTFELGDLQNFENTFDQIKKKYNLDTTIAYKNPTNIWGDILPFLIPFGIILLFWIFIMKRMSGGAGGGPGGQIFNIGKSKAKLFDQKNDVKTTFKNVAGLEGAKEEVQEVVDFLRNPGKYTSLGGKIPKGVMLVGPPGTGKTH